MLYFADQSTILFTMLKIGAVGLVIAMALYAVWAALTKKRFPAPMKTHILRYVFLTYLVCVRFLTLMPQDGSCLLYTSQTEADGDFTAYAHGRSRSLPPCAVA